MAVMTKKKQTKTIKATFKEDMIAFINNNITKTESNAMIVIKPLWANYFRVNFIIKEYLTTESIISNNKITDSRFIEVIDANSSLKIIDKTIRK